MTLTLIGTGISGAFLLLILVLFTVEQRRGARVLSRVRTHADYLVLRVTHSVRHFFGYVLLRGVRQGAHYLFHIILSGVLHTVRALERSMRTMMQVNKARARSVERERASHSKLEEIALHKMKIALSEEERIIHKERALNGR